MGYGNFVIENHTEKYVCAESTPKSKTTESVTETKEEKTNNSTCLSLITFKFPVFHITFF